MTPLPIKTITYVVFHSLRNGAERLPDSGKKHRNQAPSHASKKNSGKAPGKPSGVASRN
jgi:hypothetical protein